MTATGPIIVVINDCLLEDYDDEDNGEFGMLLCNESIIKKTAKTTLPYISNPKMRLYQTFLYITLVATSIAFGIISLLSLDNTQQQVKDAPPTPEGLSWETSPLKHQQLLPVLRPTTTTPPPVKLTETSLSRFIIVPEYKLLFCSMEKVGGSMLNDFFRILRLLTPLYDSRFQLTPKEQAFQAQETWWRNTPTAHGLSTTDLEALIENPDWTKAVFFRDPASRFLSAFRSKCGHQDSDGQIQCSPVFGEDIYQMEGTPASFQRATARVWYSTKRRHAAFSNEHYMPQARFCGGLAQTLEHYDFVQQFTPATSEETMKRLLVDHLGVPQRLWDDYLVQLIQTGGSNWKDLLPVFEEKLHWNGTIRFNSYTRTQHNTGTNHKDTLGSFYDPNTTTLGQVHKVYAEDYELFRLSKLNETELAEWLGK